MRSPFGPLIVLLLATSASLMGTWGCTKRLASVNAVDRETVIEIARELGLPADGTEVVQLTNDGDRDVAIVLTAAEDQYTLWCAYRFSEKQDRKPGEWKLLTRYAVIEDGTGAEETIKRVYTERPDLAAISAFGAEALKRE